MSFNIYHQIILDNYSLLTQKCLLLIFLNQKLRERFTLILYFCFSLTFRCVQKQHQGRLTLNCGAGNALQLVAILFNFVQKDTTMAAHSIVLYVTLLCRRVTQQERGMEELQFMAMFLRLIFVYYTKFSVVIQI